MDKNKALYNLGKIYCLAQQKLPKIFDQTGKTSTAALHPLAGLGEVIKLLNANNAMDAKLDAEIAELLEGVDIDDSDKYLETASTELQGYWWLGYYSIIKDTKKGIKAMRNYAGKLQTELAKELSEKTGKNITQKDVSRWENGKNAPGSETLKIIAEILNCKVDDLIL